MNSAENNDTVTSMRQIALDRQESVIGRCLWERLNEEINKFETRLGDSKVARLSIHAELSGALEYL